ncbi:MAG TPA: hypothetical protein VIL49_01965 [Capillimicrobium sp.]|jgi:hypothetical protein
MSLIPSRQSKKRKAVKAARKAAKTAAKAKAVQKAPKTAAAVWAGKRGGTIVRAVAVIIGAAVALKVVRGALGGGGDAPEPAAPPAPSGPASVNGSSSTYRSTPTPASSQQTEGGGASGPDPAGPTETEQAKAEAKGQTESATPPHGDPLAEDALGTGADGADDEPTKDA